MKHSSRIVLFLILTLLFRTSAFAYSVPMELAMGSISSTIHVSADHCPEMDAMITPSAPDQHSSSSCQISCALGAAPAFVQQSWQLPIQSHVVSIFVLFPLNGKDALPPDTPPPIL